MNGTINMFSAKKVKIHGMISSKWTTQDKIGQYKKLINLYTRDHKIIQVDRAVHKKKLYRELKGLQKNVEQDRRVLDNVIRGDKQLLRNTLADYKELQLAYQNTQPERVAECVSHNNFIKRKAVDKLLYQNFLKTKKLIELKEEQALLSHRLKFAFFGQIQQERDAQIISGKVQEAILKKEAALAIKQIYCNIIDIMRKDALYFDAIITTIEQDSHEQSKCILGATRLGQLATEYMDDRKQEYHFLQKAIVSDMEIRRNDIKTLEEQVESAKKSFKGLLRKESDVNVCVVKLPHTPSIKDLHTNAAQIESTLKYLKNTTLVPTYEAIYPCLEQQLAQKKRLKIMGKKYERDRDFLLNKKNHAELMNSTIKNTMVEITSHYKENKTELIRSISEINKEIRKNEVIQKYHSNITANIRTALRQLLQLSKLIKVNEDRNKTSLNPTIGYDNTPILRVPERDEIDAYKILPILIHRFTHLMTSYQAKLDRSKSEEAYRTYEAMMIDRMIQEDDKFIKEISDPSLLNWGYVEISHQLTREDIKRQSEDIVAANTVNEDLVPLFDISRRKKFSQNK